MCLIIFRGHPSNFKVTQAKIRRFESKITRPVTAIKSLRFALLKVIHQIARSHGLKKRQFWAKLGVSGLKLQFEFTDGCEMMHKAGNNIEDVSYCFSRSSIKFQGHTGQKIADFDPNWAFPDCSSNLNSPMDFEMMHKAWCNIEEVPYCFPRSSIKFQGHTGQKIADFDPNWAFLDCNFSLNSLMDLKWYTKLDVA